MIFTIRNLAPLGSTLSADAFNEAIGREYPVTFFGEFVGGAVLLSAEVLDAGTIIELTFRTDGLTGLAVEDLPVATVRS